jgi:mannosyl-3-phosphoglycerate phosphatase
MIVIFTDLDGTLLDSETYSHHAALPALERARSRGVPVVFVTSKTFAEVEVLRRSIGNDSPFVVENGAAIFAPAGSLQLRPGLMKSHENYDVAEIGTPYIELTHILKTAAREAGCRLRGFADMTVEEISLESGLDLEQASLARQRGYDEPFLLDEGDPEALRRAIERRGAQLVRGGRFFHITGSHDKETAVALLIDAYRQKGRLQTIGLGDGPNDIGFLSLVDHPVILDSPFADDLKRRIPMAIHAGPGASGWNQAVLRLLADVGG